MTPEKRRDFERQWPPLARRVEGMLVRKGVPACRRDDILQETALRLIRVWDDIDPLKSVSGLATTIALNLLRDECRRKSDHDALTELSEVSDTAYVEEAGLARVELGRVRTAMSQLSPAQRQALLAEIGDGDPTRERRPNAEKMLRLRARKKLMSVMEKVSGALLLRLRRATDLLQISTSGLREALVQSVSCLGCVALGLAVGANGRVTAPNVATAASTGVDGARGSVIVAEIPDTDRMSTIRHGSSNANHDGSVRNRVVETKPRAEVKRERRAPDTDAPPAPTKPESADEPGELPVEVPETGVPPAPIPKAPAPEVPDAGEVPTPPEPPVSTPPMPENSPVGQIVSKAGINADLPVK